MADGKQYFPIYYEWNDAFERLSDKQLGALLRAMIIYSRDGIEPALNGALALVFSVIKPQLDRVAETYVDICEKNRKNGCKGGRPRKDSITGTSDEDYINIEEKKPKNPAVISVSEKKPKNPNETKRNETNTNETNPNEHTPNEGGVGETACARVESECGVSGDNGDAIKNGFARFWEVYPKKQAKADAEKAWDEIKPDIELTESILSAVARQMRSDDWLRDGGRYVPLPANFIRKRRWEDVAAPPPAEQGDGSFDLDEFVRAAMARSEREFDAM